MQADISILEKEIRFSTARSGGAGGQNVNKVETAVTGYWIPSESALISGEQLPHLLRHIAHRLNKEGVLQVKSQVHRSQYANRLEVIEKIATIIEQALQPRKPRIATKMPGAIKEKRLANKKRRAEIKQGRRRQSYME